MEKQKPGIARACSFIINLAEHEAVMTKLPSLRALASAAGVSFVTMWKAVKKLCTQGVLSVDKKGNYRIAKKNGSGNDEEKKTGRAHCIFR